MSTTIVQDREFISALISSSLLEEAIQWITDNMSPEEVYSDLQLKDWAESAGYVLDET
jgi:hypothetical protein